MKEKIIGSIVFGLYMVVSAMLGLGLHVLALTIGQHFGHAAGFLGFVFYATIFCLYLSVSMEKMSDIIGDAI